MVLFAHQDCLILLSLVKFEDNCGVNWFDLEEMWLLYLLNSEKNYETVNFNIVMLKLVK